ncbi:MAG: hypothetical protein Q8O22_03445 [Candidatus Omnitrophota bacterium]|nr:hypothetical protein [Candidatus Omnitrophota bacterium]
MKKAILLTIGLISISAICFAEEKAAPRPETVKSSQEQPVVVKELVPVKLAAKEEKAVSVKDVIKEDKVVPVKAVVKEKAATEKPEDRSFSGKVMSVMAGNTAAGIQSQLVVINDSGQMMAFIDEPGSSIIAVNAKALNVDDEVSIEYTYYPGKGQKIKSIKRK